MEQFENELQQLVNKACCANNSDECRRCCDDIISFCEFHDIPLPDFRTTSSLESSNED